MTSEADPVRLRRDVERLAGTLAHRGSNTESERDAALYMAERFRESTPDVEIDDFHSIESNRLLFAAYYGEFVVVSLLAHWWPFIAFGYGCVVLTAYLAELTGYRVFSRLLPHYASQNVVARFNGLRPQRLIVVSAHCDSPTSSRLESPGLARRLRPIQFGLVLCMTVIVVCSAAHGYGLFEDAAYPMHVVARWSAVGVLLAAAAFLLHTELNADHSRGASDNASGLAVLLALAERFAEEPLERADVWLAATGSKEPGLNGMRHLLATHDLPRDNACFINIDDVGGGRIVYTRSEGLLRRFGASSRMLERCRALAPAYGAEAAQGTGLPSDALIPLTRGYDAVTLTARRAARTDGRLPCDDTPADLDYAVVAAAAGFAEALARRIEGEADAAEPGVNGDGH